MLNPRPRLILLSSMEPMDTQALAMLDMLVWDILVLDIPVLDMLALATLLMLDTPTLPTEPMPLANKFFHDTQIHSEPKLYRHQENNKALLLSSRFLLITSDYLSSATHGVCREIVRMLLWSLYEIKFWQRKK